MKKLFFPLLILILLYTLSADEPILQLDTGGHTGVIRDIIVTKDKDIISAGYDKTIRVWDNGTGREKRKILGEIGAGSEGMIYAIALSPDEEYLAVGGYFGSNRQTKGNIRIYHYLTGKLIKLLKSHTDVVISLSFSEDGRYLISGSGDTTAKIWDLSDNFTLTDTISFHIKEVYAVEIIQKGDQYFAVAAGSDSKIAFYDIKNRKIIASDIKDLELFCLAINKVKKHIAVSGIDNEIFILDYNLHLIKTIQLNDNIIIELLDYSRDGDYLIAGYIYRNNSINIYNVNQNYSLKSSLKKQVMVLTVDSLNNQTVVSINEEEDISFWDIDTGKSYNKIAEVGETVWSVGIRGDRIAWGNKLTTTKGRSKLQKSINLKNFSIDTGINQSSFKPIPTSNDSYSLSRSNGGDSIFNDAVLNIKKNGKVVASITRDSTNGSFHSCYGWYKDYIISGGSDGQLKIYNKGGEGVASLIGHAGTVMSIALDGDRLISGSGDQMIRVWDLSEIETKSELHPVLNLFTTKDNEWVIWSQSGYYNASVEGDKYIGYHINQGADKEAYFVSSDKYADTLYRPDIIDAILETGSEEKAIENISSKRKVKQADIVVEMPPLVTLRGSSNYTTEKSIATVKFDIRSSSSVEYIISRNGEKIPAKPSGEEAEKTISIDLDKGENIISIRAKNQYAVSDEILINVTRESHRGTEESSGTKQVEANLYKPTLYLLSIGVSKYKNSDYDLEVADKDAKSIVEIFKKQEGKIYKKVIIKQLINQDTTKDNILDALEWVERETTQRDMVIIFVAGHGINDDKGNYYFMAHDSDVNNLRRTALRWTEIKDTLSDLPSKVILMVDTCHSGNIMGQERRRDLTGAIKSIINSGAGSVIMTASTGRGYSIEKSEWGHGAFTKAMIEGLGNARADYNKNNTISIKEIDLYVTDRVKELTKGKQKPTTIIPESIPDFALGVR